MKNERENELRQRKAEKKEISSRSEPLVTEMQENEERFAEVGGTYRLYRKMDGRLYYINFTAV